MTPKDDVLERWISQARKGYFEMLLLSRLQAGRAYGYQIVASLKRAPGFEALAEGTIYPVLARMKKDGLVTAEWVATDAGAPRKYYTTTAFGADVLTEMRRVWKRMGDVLDNQGMDS
ncbi:PadR family transcriptional regulator [Hyphobacterium marinum]|uniref:PadR family transcriptional regulator n=1 Tax=Hyphobacterium marinum TaxID=3116574 RepID=A0ABU7LXP9_9PROT|nr:PadR family transcriptional regulator [Hyphobacterium sp. Y6023]MEE2566322.1 PadR family transcriptional regulator [Hyphobacterium sp. Y6023]